MKKAVAYVYYRSIPSALSSYILKTPGLTLVKDGVRAGTGHSCPRLTVVLDEGVEKEVLPKKDVMRGLERLLYELSANNQIVSYGILEKF